MDEWIPACAGIAVEAEERGSAKLPNQDSRVGAGLDDATIDPASHGSVAHG
jgi:hypothetical protein